MNDGNDDSECLEDNEYTTDDLDKVSDISEPEIISSISGSNGGILNTK